jgi:hypothetical protein
MAAAERLTGQRLIIASLHGILLISDLRVRAIGQIDEVFSKQGLAWQSATMAAYIMERSR